MSERSSINDLWRPLMDCPTIRTDRCVVCGRRYPLNQHHLVKRSAGELWIDGKKQPKPTITLCGNGNILAHGGRLNCHGLAHHGRLHFRWKDGFLWALMLDRATRYSEALKMDGWTMIWPKNRNR